MNAAEEARAEAYRATMRARAATVNARERALTGDAARAAAVRDAWAPITDRDRDRRASQCR